MRFLYILLLGCIVNSVFASIPKVEFSLYKHESSSDGPTLLVIGGIQGDEPGGFNAASLLVTDYSVNKGNLWVVPNLNFISILKRSRGVHGDMNRKFASIKRSDPEFDAVEKIKSIILDKQVDIVLNLHDGSGFFRKDYIDKLHNPNRWGQSIIIDQSIMKGHEYGELESMAKNVVTRANTNLSLDDYHLKVKNTHTLRGNTEMEKSLTYFSVRNNKPAFGVEASKSFPTHKRTFVHLTVVESFMRELGIEFKRNFNISSQSVKQRIDNNVRLTLYDSRIHFDMARARSRLGYVPMQKDAPLEYSASNPLVAIVNRKGYYNVRYGNRQVTRLHPEYFEFDNSLKQVSLSIDGKEIQSKLGAIIKVNNSFKIKPLEGYRINIIGFKQKGITNESGIRVEKSQISRRFSIDKKAQIYRVEVYRENRFCGMLLLDFSGKSSA